MKTILDWSSYENAGVGDAYADIPKNGGDFAKAVAVCINSRHCEEKGKGVMCPSYRISDNPLLSTGGRVRLLKAALNSEQSDTALHNHELAQAMDLCVSCKGCKRECENEVDMAMIKMEYLAQRHAKHAVPLRTCLFANLPTLLARYPWLTGIIELRNSSKILASLTQRLLGISAKRRLPSPVKKPFFIQHRNSEAGQTFHPNEDKRQVVLFIDTFTQNFEPQNAQAAMAILQASGYEVHVAQPDDGDDTPLCCGRTQLAHGLIEGARDKARRVLGALAPYVAEGIPVLGLEPACLLAIRDDYKFLGLGEQAEKTAKQALLFEEFIAKEHTAKRLQLDLKPLPHNDGPTLIHGHCHQKAVGAMKSMRKVLKLIPDFQFELIESSCCGMAGSFGLEAEHREDSLAMAELSLLPAIRNKPEAAIVANGFSCRHQIEEGSGRRPVHVAVLLQQSLQASPQASLQ
jgi:glycerol-3-phosphate dehydrogenase subunit C